MNKQETLATLTERKIVALVRGKDADLLAKAIRAVYDEGIRVIEVTWTVPKADKLLRRLGELLPSDALLGAGTIVNREQCVEAIEAGARFIVSPSLEPEVVRMTLDAGLVSVPGTMTPTEIMQAKRAGADLIKIFPAATMGPHYFKHLRGPFPDIPFVAAGGVNAKNIEAFYDAGVGVFAVGSELIGSKLVKEENWTQIRKNAAIFVRLVEKLKKDE